MTGYNFLCLDESGITPLNIPHPLHRAKILSHAEQLRGVVLGRAGGTHPLLVADWSPVDLAGWVHEKAHEKVSKTAHEKVHEKRPCPFSALKILQRRMDGGYLQGKGYEEILQVLGGEREDRDTQRAAEALRLLLSTQPVAVRKEGEEGEEGEEVGVGKMGDAGREGGRVEGGRRSDSKMTKLAGKSTQTEATGSSATATTAATATATAATTTTTTTAAATATATTATATTATATTAAAVGASANSTASARAGEIVTTGNMAVRVRVREGVGC